MLRSAASFSETNLAGEVTQTSVILQSRLGAGDTLVDGDIPGVPGWGYFEVSTDSTLANAVRTDWLHASPENDFMLKAEIEQLRPNTRYFYRVRAGATRARVEAGHTSTFRTLPPTEDPSPFGFAMISCMNYEKFHGLADMEIDVDWIKPATGDDRRLGYPALDVLRRLEPGFIIGNGDNVYYDRPRQQPARRRDELRAKWHRLFAMPRMRRISDRIPFYWLKDDHDYRFNDADTTNRRTPEPSHPLGVATFREQVPVVDPSDPAVKTYRTYRVNSLLQMWMLEGRDYRSPNDGPDGPHKTLWGEAQKEWLKRTLKESDAPFKVIVSPTPIVGPDDATKRDNHTNPDGFLHEGTQFIDWLAESRLLSPSVFVINGDRHWQYHSIHAAGLEEFGSGALIKQNARFGRAPGDPNSTDPEGRTRQPYLQAVPIGGFLYVSVSRDELTRRPSILFTFYDEEGKVLYAARRYAAARPPHLGVGPGQPRY